MMLLCFAAGRGHLAGRSSGGKGSGLGQREEVGPSACCSTWKREGVRVLLTAHAAPETWNTSLGGRCSHAMAEGGLAPSPWPPRCVHCGGLTAWGPWVPQCCLAMGCPVSARGPRCGGRRSRLLCCSTGAGTLSSFQLCQGRPRVSSWGSACWLVILKVHRAINTREHGCQRPPGPGCC